MLRRLCLFFLLSAAVVSGCGSTETFVSTGSVTNVTQVVNNLSGRTGEIEIRTSLAPIPAQSVVVIEDDAIPAEVDELRFTGYDTNGFPIYGVIRAKAATILLTEVPIEVVSLRVELLVNGLVIGGLSTPVTVGEGETTVLGNPTYIFPGVVVGPEGPPGPPGPEGPTGPPGVVATAYGSWVERSPQTVDGEFQRFVDFSELTAAVDVVRLADEDLEAPVGLYQVTQEGDYLVTYSIQLDEFQGSTFFEFLVLDAEDVTQDSYRFQIFQIQENLGRALQAVQFVVSLDAGARIALDSDGAAEIAQGTFSIVRLGPSTGASLPTEPQQGD